ncbi:MAG: hypothetical protein E7256_04485 [Lachnospiraceae bacterium]|nr:hypothetical protein [Lachnospiraceae bacterium]
MGLAWKEMKHSRKKFVLIEAILVLMIFMVIFLSGLANGLKRAVSAAIENTDAVSFVLSEGADDLITVSSLDTGLLEQIQGMTGGDGTPLNIQRMNMKQEGSETKLDITYFAIDPKGY